MYYTCLTKSWGKFSDETREEVLDGEGDKGEGSDELIMGRFSPNFFGKKTQKKMEMEATPTHKSPEIVNCEGQDGGREGHNARLTLQAHNFHSNFSKTQIFLL